MNMPTAQEFIQLWEVITIWIKYIFIHLAFVMPIMLIIIRILNVNKKLYNTNYINK
ncbi:TPA: hypothetical protein LA462_000344 [Clostridium botulinum]|nr:hypothetical protein [Clostridium botulinum]